MRSGDALFCRECGKPLAEKASASGTDDSVTEVDPTTQVTESKASDSQQAPATVEADDDAGLSATETESVLPPPAAEAAVETKAGDTQIVHRRGEKTRERLHRASDIARGVTRGVIEEPVKRVEQIRHASTVVIEEASYDPSLRFVLVALGLFVVFIILLVLSKVMG